MQIYQRRAMLIIALAATVMAGAATAQALDLNPVQNLLQSIADAITGPIGLIIGTIAIAGVGFAWLFGMINFKNAIYVVLGLVLVASAATIAAAVFA